MTEGTLQVEDDGEVSCSGPEHTWENHHPIHWEKATVLGHGRKQELLVKEAPDIKITQRSALTEMVAGSPWLLVRCDEEAGVI